MNYNKGFIFGCSLILLTMACHTSDHGEHTHSHEHNSDETNSEEVSIGFAHNVYLWLKDDMTTQQISDFEKALDKLGTCPTISSFYWGKPANTPRDIVDNSYDYALNVLFESKENHDAYQEDPIHEEFRQTCGDFFEKVQIYDNLID